MTNPEFIQSAANVVHQARELIDAGAKANLLQTLTDFGHPYGLLLTEFPFTSQEQKSSFFLLSSLNYPIISSTRAVRGKIATERGHYYDKEIGGAPPMGFERSSIPLSFGNTWKALDSGKALLAASIFKSLFRIGIENNLFQKSHLDNLFAAQAVLAPGILKSLTELGERPRDLRVGRNQIGLGTSSIHLGTYHGETPYVIKSPAGEPLAQISPGETLGSVHVSSQAWLLRNLSPLEKIEQITEDFMDLLKAIDYGGSPELNEAQQKTLARAGQATIIGISHLVRLFGRKTGLPTWKLDVLPELVQRFHQHDSQAVSKTFGGTRKVRVSDVEMMVVTPAMRQQLTAVYA